MKKLPIRIALSGTILALLTSAVSAQIRVDARIHASSGSCAQCDLSNKRMNGVKLKDANFAGSSFNNSNLSGGKLDGSNLTGAHFRKALMLRVEGDNVMMESAVLEDATLTEAKVSNSILKSANLRRADLSRGEFKDNDFTHSNLVSVKAPNVNFTKSNFAHAKMDHVNLHAAILDEAQLQSTTFGYAIMNEASLKGADLSDAKMGSVQGLKQAQLDDACGNMNTELPEGLSVPYCEGHMLADMNHNHARMNPKFAKAARRLDRAIRDVEIILDATPRNNRPLRRKLESIHSDLVNSKKALEE